jgi:dynein heavy chain
VWGYAWLIMQHICGLPVHHQPLPPLPPLPPQALSVPHYQLSSLATYYVPEAAGLQSFKDYITTLPTTDRPEAFGQHGNAEISYLIEDSRVVLDTLLELQPADAGGSGGSSREDLVMGIATDLLEQIPEPFNLEQVG